MAKLQSFTTSTRPSKLSTGPAKSQDGTAVAKGTQLDGIRAEIQRTISDLIETAPGLQCTVLISLPTRSGDVDATLFATHDLAQSAYLIARIIKLQQEAAKPLPPDTPEAV